MKVTAMMILLFLSMGLWSQKPNIDIHHFDVGQGECTLVVGTNGRGLLMDAGSSKYCVSGDPNRLVNEIAALLAGNDYYILASHYHSDHIGWIPNLVNALGPPVIAFDRGSSYGSGAFNDYLTAVTGPPDVRQTIMPGDMLSQGLDLGPGVSVSCVVSDGEILNGGTVTVSSENARSIGVLISYRGFDYLACGDLQEDVEPHLGNALVATAPGQVEVYKVNHHGSGTSSVSEFLDSLLPTISICSVGSHGSYDHPRREAYNRIHSAGSVIYQTCPGSNSPVSYVQPPDGWGWLLHDEVLLSTNGLDYKIDNPSTPGGYDSYRVQEPLMGCPSLFSSWNQAASLCTGLAVSTILDFTSFLDNGCSCPDYYQALKAECSQGPNLYFEDFDTAFSGPFGGNQWEINGKMWWFPTHGGLPPKVQDSFLILESERDALLKQEAQTMDLFSLLDGQELVIGLLSDRWRNTPVFDPLWWADSSVGLEFFGAPPDPHIAMVFVYGHLGVFWDPNGLCEPPGADCRYSMVSEWARTSLEQRPIALRFKRVDGQNRRYVQLTITGEGIHAQQALAVIEDQAGILLNPMRIRFNANTTDPQNPPGDRDVMSIDFVCIR